MQTFTLETIVKEVFLRLKNPISIKSTMNCLEKSNLSLKLQYPYMWGEMSLSDGYPGILLFISTLAKIGKGFELSEEIEHVYILKIKDLLESNGYYSLSLFNGLAGICFSIHYASHGGKRYQRMLKTLHTLLISQVNKVYLDPIKRKVSSIAHSSSFYDVIQGICGIGRYALEHLHQPHFQQLAEDINKTLIELCLPITIDSHVVPGWYLPATDVLNKEHQSKYPKGNFNLGLSHGVAGILAYLSIAYQKGVVVDKQKDTIKEISDWIKKKSFKKNSLIRWPTTVSWEEEVDKKQPSYFENYQDSWCYGVPGISRSLLLAGKVLKDENLKDFAITAFRGVFSRTQDERNLPGPAICHGIAGLLLLTNEMSREDGCSDLNYFVNMLRKKLLTTYNPDAPFGFSDVDFNQNNKHVLVNKPGLLEGSAGILLTLLSVSNTSLKWHLPLMISA